MPLKETVIEAFTAMQVTPAMLKYGIPIDGLDLLQRCALFVWFNSFLPEDEKLLVPMCILPNGFDWSNEEKMWYRYCMSPDIKHWSLSESSDVIASKLWQVCEELRNDEYHFSLLPEEVKSCRNFECLKKAVAYGAVEFNVNSNDPKKLFNVLEQLKFFESEPFLDETFTDMNSLKRRVVSSKLYKLFSLLNAY